MIRRFRALPILALAAVLIVTLGQSAIPGCARRLTEDEKLMVEQLRPYFMYLEDYRRDHMCYPDCWETLLRWKGIEMPRNPCTGEPMVCLDSAEFDPDTSPGNICYITVEQDGCVVNCQVIVFGQRGEIHRYSHAGPFAAR